MSSRSKADRKAKKADLRQRIKSRRWKQKQMRIVRKDYPFSVSDGTRGYDQRGVAPLGLLLHYEMAARTDLEAARAEWEAEFGYPFPE